MNLEDLLYCFVNHTEEVERGGFLNYVVHTTTQVGEINFKFWNLKNKDSFPKSKDYLIVKVVDKDKATNEFVSYKTISLDSTSKNKPYFCDYYIVEEENIPPDIRKKINKDRSEQIKFAFDAMHKDSYWVDKKIYDFLLDTIESNLEKFKTVPAAIKYHHNYKGGLLVHSSEVFFNSYAIANSFCNKRFYYDRINSDVLYLSSWLHDIGKIEVYSLDNESPKIDFIKEKNIGHSTMSNLIFVEAAKKFGLDSEFISHVSHCILSHHRRKSWGAVVKPNTVEAHILCEADLISSKVSF